jgi:hypothetical protein
MLGRLYRRRVCHNSVNRDGRCRTTRQVVHAYPALAELRSGLTTEGDDVNGSSAACMGASFRVRAAASMPAEEYSFKPTPQR